MSTINKVIFALNKVVAINGECVARLIESEANLLTKIIGHNASYLMDATSLRSMEGLAELNRDYLKSVRQSSMSVAKQLSATIGRQQEQNGLLVKAYVNNFAGR